MSHTATQLETIFMSRGGPKKRAAKWLLAGDDLSHRRFNEAVQIMTDRFTERCPDQEVPDIAGSLLKTMSCLLDRTVYDSVDDTHVEQLIELPGGRTFILIPE